MEIDTTSAPGFYATGDTTQMGNTVACADGVIAALAIHRLLALGG